MLIEQKIVSEFMMRSLSSKLFDWNIGIDRELAVSRVDSAIVVEEDFGSVAPDVQVSH